MTAETVDVVVVGGGAVGTSAAYHLAAAGAGSVLLLEREGTLGAGSTGRCAGGFRHQFSSRINVQLSIESIRMIRSFASDHEVPLDVDVHGYLFLVRSEASWAEFVAGAELQRSLGVDVRLLSADEALALVPGIETAGVIGATFCPDDGIADPSGLTLGYATAARRAGARIRTGEDVRSIDVVAGRATGVTTSAGTVRAGAVVNAAGPWAGVLAKTAGVRIPLDPIPRHVVVTAPFDGAPPRRTLVVDAETSFYFHREGGGMLMGMAAPEERPSFETRVDDAFVSEQLLPTAIRVFPPLEQAGLAHRWVGLYEMTPDRHPVIGPAPGVEGLYLANGFSGHGFQHAPVVGKLLAEMITEGGARTVDVAPLALERFASGGVTREAHVV
ncbi:MAG: NAD(P)/FAD-dependent oxidoreductase [Actinomycetota bacterium]